MNLLDLITEQEKKLIVYQNIAKNKTLFYEGDVCTSVVILIEGEIIIKSQTPSGKEIIYNEIHKNQIFGNNLVFSNNPIYKGNVVAVKECKVAIILKQNLLNILQSNKQFLLAYLAIQSEFGKSLNDQIKILSCNKAEERLDLYFYRNNGIINYTTISDLANKLGLERETLSRLISNQEKRHQLRRLPHKLIKNN